MNKVYRIQYVDAYYVYSKILPRTALKPHEARGFVIKNGIHTAIIFINEKDRPVQVGKTEIIEGLVIPTASIGPYKPKNNLDTEQNIASIHIKAQVSVEWLDVVRVVNMNRWTCSIMYTEGILERIQTDHIVLRDPETIRTHPNPVKNHPEKKPTFYIIPKSFIKKISAL